MTIGPATDRAIPARSRTARPVLYSVSFLLVPVSYLFTVFALSSTPAVFYWLARTYYPGLGSVGYGATLKGADCDIVVYGDSTALTGIDPYMVQSIT